MLFKIFGHARGATSALFLPRPVLRERVGVRVFHSKRRLKSPLPNPLPEYRAREPEAFRPSNFYSGVRAKPAYTHHLESEGHLRQRPKFAAVGSASADAFSEFAARPRRVRQGGPYEIRAAIRRR